MKYGSITKTYEFQAKKGKEIQDYYFSNEKAAERKKKQLIKEGWEIETPH